MIIRLIVLLAFIALPCFAAGADYPTPSHDQIKSWWKPENKKSPDEELDIKDVKPIRLKSGEKAFLASVWFGEGFRARCDTAGILLVRPSLQEAREIGSSGSVSEVIELDSGQITGVVISGACTAQGETHGSNAFVYFDEWQTVVFHTRRFADNFGSLCSKTDKGIPCHSQEVIWTFTDLDGDNIKDLVELIITKDGEEPDKLSWKTQVNAYLIKDLQLVTVSPGLIQTNSTESERQENSHADEPTDMRNHKSPSSAEPKNKQSVDSEAIIGKLCSGLDQAVTNARSILSQFGLTAK